MSARTPDLVEQVIARLREHEAELRAAGIKRMSLFGSVARGDNEESSDVDIAAELDRDKRLGIFEVIGIEEGLGELLRRAVDLVQEPVEKQRLQANIDRDRRHVF